MKSNDLTTIVHLVGFLTGIVLYAMLGLMTLRTRSWQGFRSGPGGADRIPLATAALGLLWNCGALIVYGLRDLGMAAPRPWITAIAFTALGFLPAVIVHSAAQSIRHFRSTPRLVWAAYALSTSAGALQLDAAYSGDQLPYRPALLALTTGYAIIIAALALLMRRQPGWRRTLSGVALAAFAVMALHLSQHAEGADSWIIELAGHHASLPLALVILYQDYRFAFADLFIKRVLTLVALIAIATTLYLTVAVRHIMPLAALDFTDPRATSGLIALWVATALLYPPLRAGVGRFVDRFILRRADYSRIRTELAAAIAPLETADAILDALADLLAPALNAEWIRWTESAEHRSLSDPLVMQTSEGLQRVTVRVPTADAPSYELEIGSLAGGRRLLSDDLAMLESGALAIARRIDAVRVTQERIERSVRENEILQLATESELRALRAQLNPHFLFNTLTTIGFLMREAPDRALQTLYQLTGLLRAVLRRSDGEFTTLGEELDIVEAYLAIESARFEERLQVTFDVHHELRTQRIPPLVLQPLVENSIKHGIAPRKAGGAVIVAARLEHDGPGADGGVLHLSVVDTGIGCSAEQLRRRRVAGIGLSNLERRLERYYSKHASLEIRSAEDVGTTVEIRLPIRSGTGAKLVGAPS